MKLFWHRLSSRWFATMVPACGPLTMINARETLRKRRLFSGILLIAFLASFLFTIDDMLNNATLIQESASTIGWCVPLGAFWINRRGYLKCASFFYFVVTLLTAFASIYLLSLKIPVLSLYLWPVLLLVPVASGLFLPAWGPLLLCMFEIAFMYWFVQDGSQIALYIHDPQGKMQFLFLACAFIFLAAVFSAISAITTKRAVIQADRASELEQAHLVISNAYSSLEVATSALQKQALTDGLTGLPNSTSLIDSLKQAVVAATGTQSSMAVLVLDLNHFKEINDTFGHQRGDLLLQQVGECLKHSVPESNIVARLSGDEFAMVLPSADEVSAQRAASAIHISLEALSSVDGYPIQINASIGGALFPEHGIDALTLLHRADMAMATAKQLYKGYTLFDTADEHYDPQRLTLITDLRHGIGAGELCLYYQPKVELKSELTTSAEALVRWRHPTLGLIPPDQFISLAEQTGLIVPLTLWVLEEAIRQCAQWMRSGRELSVAVNLSAWNLRDTTMPEMVASLLSCYHVPARLLSIELTESAMMGDVEHSIEVLTRIFNLGVRLSIDDYGTGYSSLSYLKRLPVHELKIDRSFVQHMSTNVADTTIVRSTITLAHNFGLRIVAEGVEDRATLDLLRELDCDLAQGYFLSRPVPADEFEHWLDRRIAFSSATK